MPRAGRKRKQGVKRYSKSGQITHAERSRMAEETERQTVAVAIAARAKHTGLSEQQAAHPEAQTPYGILFLMGCENGGIDRKQKDAAAAYENLVHNAYRLKGLPTPHVKSASAVMVSTPGASLMGDKDDETVQSAWRRLHEVQDALMRAGQESGTSRGTPDVNACKRIVHNLCYEQDRDIYMHGLNSEELGNFRCGLNYVHKLLWRY